MFSSPFTSFSRLTSCDSPNGELARRLLEPKAGHESNALPLKLSLGASPREGSVKC